MKIKQILQACKDLERYIDNFVQDDYAAEQMVDILDYIRQEVKKK